MKLFLIVIFALLSGAFLVRGGELATLPAAELTHLNPLGAQRGTTVEVSVSGQHLDGATALVFSDSRITSEPKKDAKGRSVPGVLVVSIPPGVMYGMYDARVRGKFGLSNPRRFCVGKLPEITLAVTATAQDKATVLALNNVVNAMPTAGVRNWFKFHATEKLRLSIRVESPDTRLEPQLTLSDSTGRVLKRGGEELKFTASAEADYFIELHDLLFRGGADCRFRLSVLTEPVATDQRSDAMATSYVDERERIRHTLLGKISCLSKDSLTGNTGNKWPIDDVLTPPCERGDCFPPAGLPATYLLSLKKGDVYWLDVMSHRLGQATDPELIVEKVEKDASGVEKTTFVAEAPDVNPTASGAGFGLEMRDGTLKFEAKEDGVYRVSLRDLFNTAPTSPRLPYRLDVRKETFDFQLVTVPDQGPRARPPVNTHVMPPTLRRGGVASFRVFVQRQDGFAGDIALKAEGLPEGVTCLGAILGNGDECASLTFYADEKAAAWAGIVRVVGTATINGKEEKRTASSGTPIWNVTDTRSEAFRSRRTEGIGLAVVAEDAPMLLELEKPGVIEAKVGAKVPVKLKVTRRGGYDEQVKVRAFVLGDQDKAASKELTIPAKVNETMLELELAQYAAKPGEHTFVLHGLAERVKYKKNAEEIPAAEAEAKKSAQEATAAAEALKKAQGVFNAAKQKTVDADNALKQAKPEQKAALETAAAGAKTALFDAEKAVKDAETASKAAALDKTEMEKRASELVKTAAVKDMTYVVFSKPIQIKIIPEPAKK